MLGLQHWAMAALVIGATACAPKPATSDQATSTATAAAGAATPAAQESDQAAPQGGAFARKPGFQLPVPVSNAPAGVAMSSGARPVDPVAVRTAVMEGLGDAGAGVQVQVDAGGIVLLTGEVASVAEQQRAHYLARALPGVVEVDHRNLRVRQR